tara:strand:- start:1278 stop:1586 length:309 start_codon:yes stop_codon:yes gene_type:complete
MKMFNTNKKIKMLLYGLFLVFIILVHSFIGTQREIKDEKIEEDEEGEEKEGFLVLGDIYNDVTSIGNKYMNKSIRAVKNTVRDNKEMFQRTYRSIKRPSNRL